MGILTTTILVFIGIAILFIIIFAMSGHEKKTSQFYWFAIPSLLLAFWALITSWLWFYYFCMYLSLPALFLSSILVSMTSRLNREHCINKIIIGIQLGAITIGFLSAIFFDVI
ncbi:hypothetical protein [Nonlabens ulvanivorans]|uniref:hypothetical protein n=1 Tax=Nonlabens ulvanivorans TaxID=906888 RepID=UPI0037C8B189